MCEGSKESLHETFRNCESVIVAGCEIHEREKRAEDREENGIPLQRELVVLMDQCSPWFKCLSQYFALFPVSLFLR